MGLFDKLLDKGIDLGNRLRYGVPESEQVNMEASGDIPGFDPGLKADLVNPDPARREAARHASRRATSAHLATKQWGPIPALLGNLLREGAQGVGTFVGSGGQEFFTPGGLAASDPDEERGMDLRSLQNVMDVVRATQAQERAKNPSMGASLVRGLFGRNP
jgi:hypothetical protein